MMMRPRWLEPKRFLCADTGIMRQKTVALPPVTLGTIQSPAAVGSAIAQTKTITGFTVGSANKVLVILQFGILYNYTDNYSTTSVKFNGVEMVKLWWSRPPPSGAAIYQYGYVLFCYLDNPTAGDIIVDWPSTNQNYTVKATVIPLIGAAMGGAAFGNMVQAAGGNETSMPMSLTTAVAGSWIFAAFSRRDNGDGPYAWSDSTVNTNEIAEWAGSGNAEAGSGVVSYRTAPTIQSYNMGCTANNTGAAADYAWSGAAVEVLNTPGSFTFSEDFTGSNGAAWSSSKWANIGVGSTSIMDIQSNAGRMLAQGAVYTYCRADAIVGVLANFELLGTFTLATTGEQYVDFNVRSTGQSGTGVNLAQTGYLFEVDGGGNTMGFYKITGGASGSALTTAAKTWGTSAWNFRIQCVGSTIRGRWWQGTPEPAAWDISWVDSAIVSGGIKLAAVNGNAVTARTATWDNISLVAA